MINNNFCLTGDTVIAVADGRNGVKIKDLCNTKFPVYSARVCPKKPLTALTKDKWGPEIKMAEAINTGEKHIVTIYLSDGSYFKCTPDHKLALCDGTYVSAKDSKGKQLAKFFSFSDKNDNTQSYRHINSLKNNRQYTFIANYNHLIPDDSLDYVILHKDKDSTNDFIENLYILTSEEYKKQFAEEQSGHNTVTKDINFKYNQGLKQVKANAAKYHWSENRLNEELHKYMESHKMVEKTDANVYYTDSVSVTDVIDENKVEDVYNLTVEANHNFYIITKTDDDKFLNCSGILVHNCNINNDNIVGGENL